MRRAAGPAGAGLLAGLLGVYISWPQALRPTMVADHFDPYFSTWRLGHIAHALVRDPLHLFDGNIFYPLKDTLAFSDAILLPGIVGAPFMWAGLSPTLVYNLMMLAGFVGSGAGMYILARHLSGSAPAALLATAVFALLPYRTEHLMHLEMQWAGFIPLTLWAVHRTAEEGRARHAVMTGVFLWLQFLSCIYYGVFLALMLLVFVPLLAAIKGHVRARTFIPRLAGAAFVAAVLTLPYALPYIRAARTVGQRDVLEIAKYSATPASYFASNALNRVWGWTADRFGSMELRLFPGAIALIFALAAAAHPRRRLVLVYVATAALVIELSFGLNGTLYPAMLGHISALQGFRALARFGMIVGCLVSVLAALGFEALKQRAPSGGRWGAFATLMAVALVLESANRPMPLSAAVPAKPAPLYDAVRRAGTRPMIELPLPLRGEFPGLDPNYEAWSLWHWRPLVNGYSGYYPQSYQQLLRAMERFPDERSIAMLRDRDVQFVILHRDFYDATAYTELELKLAQSRDFQMWGRFRDPVGTADIFELRPR
jgi:hypothetical protein